MFMVDAMRNGDLLDRKKKKSQKAEIGVIFGYIFRTASAIVNESCIDLTVCTRIHPFLLYFKPD
jgi:hypothetical protein